MKHLKNLSAARAIPASTLETQQKLAVINSAITAFAALAEALGAWFNLFGSEE